MGKTDEGTECLRAEVLAPKGQNLSHSAISRALGRSRRFVLDIIKRFSETGSFASHNRTGRPSVSTSKTDRLVKRYVSQHPHDSSNEILHHVQDHFIKSR